MAGIGVARLVTLWEEERANLTMVIRNFNAQSLQVKKMGRK
jgi:hypothetical protein